MRKRVFLGLVISAFGTFFGAAPAAPAQAIIVQSWCTRCGRTLPFTRPGQACPYCGSSWIAQRPVVADSVDTLAVDLPPSIRPASTGVILEKVVHKPDAADLQRAEKLAAAGRLFRQIIVNGAERSTAFARMPGITLTDDEVALLQRVNPTESLRPLPATLASFVDEPSETVTVFFQVNGKTEQVTGRLVQKNADWIVIATPDGVERLRAASVDRIVERKGTVRPAVGK